VANYINNKSLHGVLVKFYYEMKEGKDPPISNYVGECISLICEKIGSRSNFNGYTYIDEMIDDGKLHCIAAVPKYNPEKSKNAFGYFSRICWRAFLQRIQEEKKQNYIKHKNYQNIHMFDQFATGSEDSHGDVSDNEHNNTVISDFELKIQEKKKKMIEEEAKEELIIDVILEKKKHKKTAAKKVVKKKKLVKKKLVKKRKK
jgi:hypothetical protein